jgi:hypothetical protein
VRLALAPAAYDTFIIKMRIPKSDSAMDQDTVRISVRVQGRHCLGANDNWPNTSVRAVFDSSNIFIHTHASAGLGDTLWDYGDTQRDTVFVAIGGPIIKTCTKVTLIDAARKPGDRLLYTMYYDNDGSATSVDTGFFVAYLPNGAMLLDTITTSAGNASTIKTYVRYNNTWINHVPDNTTPSGYDSLARVTAVRFAVPPGINSQSGTNADNALRLTADDSTGTDAGMIKFRVKIR